MDGEMWLRQEKKPSRIAFNLNLIKVNKSQAAPNLLALHLTSILTNSHSSSAAIISLLLNNHMTLMETVIWYKVVKLWILIIVKPRREMQAFLTSISLHHNRKKPNNSLSNNKWTSFQWILRLQIPPKHNNSRNQQLRVLNLISILDLLILPLLLNKIQMLVDFHSNSTKAKQHNKLRNHC